jgi:hypothetical protein
MDLLKSSYLFVLEISGKRCGTANKESYLNIIAEITTNFNTVGHPFILTQTMQAALVSQE